MSRRLCTTLAVVGAVALPFALPAGQERPRTTDPHRRVEPTAKSARRHLEPAAPVLTIDGLLLASRVRASRSAMRVAPKSPPAGLVTTGSHAETSAPDPLPKPSRRATEKTGTEPGGNRYASTYKAATAGVQLGAAAWARTLNAVRVANCESGDRHGTTYNGNPHLPGRHSGKWQMDADFWATYGGLQYAPTPASATEAEQDAVAYRGWLDRGWQPWTCARIMGVR